MRSMESWSIELEKEYFKFSAAHFLIFPDGSAERLHGHRRLDHAAEPLQTLDRVLI